MDRIAIVVALAAFFIRMGNFFNSEILGSAANIPWAIIFTRIDTIPRHPAQIYEALSYLIIFIIMIIYYNSHRSDTKGGFLLGFFLLTVFGARFIIEYFKEVQVEFEGSLPLHLGQFLSIPFVIIGIYFLVKAVKRKSLK